MTLDRNRRECQLQPMCPNKPSRPRSASEFLLPRRSLRSGPIAAVILVSLLGAIFAGCAGVDGAASNESEADLAVAPERPGSANAGSGQVRVDTPESPTEEREIASAASADAGSPPTSSPDPEPSRDRGESAEGAESEESAGTAIRESSASDRSPLELSSEFEGTPRISGESGLSAGLSDDNQQYGYFVNFLTEYADAVHIELDVTERIILRLVDSEGLSVPNADVVFSVGQRVVERGKSSSDGTYQFNPSIHPAERYDVRIEGSAGTSQFAIDRHGERRIEHRFDARRIVPTPAPLDIVFILDTTGSMGEEIDRLRRTIELIHLNLTGLDLPTFVRFGMVLYKDIGDEYHTSTVGLTSDLRLFQSELDLVFASGGGDTPEDLQAALYEVVHSIDWNTDGIRLGFIITDAPPHLDYGQEYDYTDAVRDARREAIKLFTVGTGGLDIDGEYVLRQIAQFTGAAYVFLTYGEGGESEGGVPGSVSHHTGSNYQTDKLEAVIIRLAKEALAEFTGNPMKQLVTYFTASKVDNEAREETLSILFGRAIEELADYSTFAVDAKAPAAVLPIEASGEEIAADAEYFTEQLLLAASRSARLTLVERLNLDEILQEQKIQLSGITDSETVTKIGELMNASYLVSGSLFLADEYELFLRLLRVDSGEVLSVTKAIIDRELGVSMGDASGGE